VAPSAGAETDVRPDSDQRRELRADREPGDLAKARRSCFRSSTRRWRITTSSAGRTGTRTGTLGRHPSWPAAGAPGPTAGGATCQGHFGWGVGSSRWVRMNGSTGAPAAKAMMRISPPPEPAAQGQDLVRGAPAAEPRGCARASAGRSGRGWRARQGSDLRALRRVGCQPRVIAVAMQARGRNQRG